MPNQTSEQPHAPTSESEFNAMLKKLAAEIYMSALSNEWNPHLAADVTQQTFLQRRSLRPSCIGGFLRFARCGTIRSIPRFFSRPRNASLSAALS